LLLGGISAPRLLLRSTRHIRYSLSSRFQVDARTERTTTPAQMRAMVRHVGEQLGLKFERARGPVELLVIDSVQQPTPI